MSVSVILLPVSTLIGAAGAAFKRNRLELEGELLLHALQWRAFTRMEHEGFDQHRGDVDGSETSDVRSISLLPQNRLQIV
ncbi:hypothetical protein WGT02_25285 (plasmid) [Rhizobium sp. T1470]|uniref:hypothetical protein n=1 Tax=unclassified Rhizobium TaxID=2613769 RepID=UPI001AAEC26A|nr:hypothetical protein [Rhizobium sp. T1473]MCA0805718.1 hypothetical protein [Rhizobium sp. T1473]